MKNGIIIAVVGAAIIWASIICSAVFGEDSTKSVQTANSVESSQVDAQTSSASISSNNSDDSKLNNSELPKPQKADNIKGSGDSKIAGYDVVIESCRLTTEKYTGKEYVIVKYKFTNNSKRECSFYSAVGDKAFQNGVELRDTIFYGDGSGYDSGDVYKDIKPGTTQELERAYELNDTVTDVTVEISAGRYSSKGAKITKTFSIA